MPVLVRTHEKSEIDNFPWEVNLASVAAMAVKSWYVHLFKLSENNKT
jgi:hypothetical protein